MPEMRYSDEEFASPAVCGAARAGGGGTGEAGAVPSLTPAPALAPTSNPLASLAARFRSLALRAAGVFSSKGTSLLLRDTGAGAGRGRVATFALRDAPAAAGDDMDAPYVTSWLSSEAMDRRGGVVAGGDVALSLALDATRAVGDAAGDGVEEGGDEDCDGTAAAGGDTGRFLCAVAASGETQFDATGAAGTAAGGIPAGEFGLDAALDSSSSSTITPDALNSLTFMGLLSTLPKLFPLSPLPNRARSRFFTPDMDAPLRPFPPPPALLLVLAPLNVELGPMPTLDPSPSATLSVASEATGVHMGEPVSIMESSLERT
mmetsp:Transcript_3705/g.9939  ORF Transcript_3705/g.9939 Transcript_3705/m.9939 type:complete len:318 (+) Transcript_3705:1124-2077(+)